MKLSIYNDYGSKLYNPSSLNIEYETFVANAVNVSLKTFYFIKHILVPLSSFLLDSTIWSIE